MFYTRNPSRKFEMPTKFQRMLTSCRILLVLHVRHLPTVYKAENRTCFVTGFATFLFLRWGRSLKMRFWRGRMSCSSGQHPMFKPWASVHSARQSPSLQLFCEQIFDTLNSWPISWCSPEVPGCGLDAPVVLKLRVSLTHWFAPPLKAELSICGRCELFFNFSVFCCGKICIAALDSVLSSKGNWKQSEFFFWPFSRLESFKIFCLQCVVIIDLLGSLNNRIKILHFIFLSVFRNWKC